MKSICLYFQVHQPFRLKRYRFFDIGNDHYYYDDFSNESIMSKVAANCYLPVNNLLLKLVNKHKGKFKVSFSLTGIAIDQFELYAPEVLESFKKLAETGSVEFLAETYSHSLASLVNEEEFEKQVEAHAKKIQEYFNQTPRVFRNTELIYSDEIGAKVFKMGYKAMLTEGAKHILGWKSPNFLYCNALTPKLKLLLRDYKLSDDIAFRFSNKGWAEYPLTAEKYVNWIKNTPANEEVINLFMDYETFGEHQSKATGILDFLEFLPEKVIKEPGLSFKTPSEVATKLQPIGAINVPFPISWADEERDVTAWLGNEMQQEAFEKLYGLASEMSRIDDMGLHKDFQYLQISDHFYYMSTKFFSDGAVHAYFNPYRSPYDAFINYMNILSDFEIRIKAALPGEGKEKDQLNKIILEKDALIQKYERKITRLQQNNGERNKITSSPGKTKKNVSQKANPKKA